MAYFYSEERAPFEFVGSEDKIARDKALVSEFRKRHGLNPDPFSPIVGSPDEVERKLALLKEFRKGL